MSIASVPHASLAFAPPTHTAKTASLHFGAIQRLQFLSEQGTPLYFEPPKTLRLLRALQGGAGKDARRRIEHFEYKFRKVSHHKKLVPYKQKIGALKTQRPEWLAHTWRFLPIGPGLSDLLATLNTITDSKATARPTEVGDVLVVSGLRDVSSLDNFIGSRPGSYLYKLMDYLLSRGQNSDLQMLRRRIQSEKMFNEGQQWRPGEDAAYFKDLLGTLHPDIMHFNLDRHLTGYVPSVDRQR
jgi:hypothetical protein